jgi:hypothetical protein
MVGLLFPIFRRAGVALRNRDRSPLALRRRCAKFGPVGRACVTALCAAVCITVSALAAPAMAARHAPEAGYYVIRWNDTGICQIWNTDLRYRPAQVFSRYKIVSKLVPTFVAATSIQLQMRAARSCTL